MRDILIGIDAGTSVIKSVAFDLEGVQVASAAIPNKYETLPGGGAEQDLARTWAATAETLRMLAEKVPDLATRTAALSVTGQGDGTWFIDKDGEPVGKGWLWLDARAAPVVEEMRDGEADRRRYALTGSGLAACQQGPQLIHMRRKMPERLAGAATAFHCKDWLYFKLTGERATDPTEGTFSYGDYRTRDYSEEVIDALGLRDMRHLFPPVVDGVRSHAALNDAAARETGLLAGTPVVLAYVDVVCTAVGAGMLDRQARPGCTIIGSTGMHMRLAPTMDDVRLNEDATGYTMCMPADGVYAQIQSNMAATLNIDWILGVASDLLAAQGVERTQAEMLGMVDGWIAASKPAALLYQPYISEAGERGPFVDANARAGFIGLSIRHGFGDMVRAVFEGLAFASRDCYAAAGGLPSQVILSGGAARSPVLRRILAATIGASVRTNRREEAGAAGAAMIAAVSIGLSPSVETCAKTWVTPLLGEPEQPDRELAEIYDRAYATYADAHRALRPIWRGLANANAR